VTDATEGEGEGLWTRLRRRKVVQWGIAYMAGAWALLQVIGFFADAFHWPDTTKQVGAIALLIGLPIVLTLAWYHGDRGQQRIGRTELAILTLLFLLGGGLFWQYQRDSDEPANPTRAAAAPASAATTAAAGPSIAVLPFENRSAQQDDAFFVDGIHDDILTQLSKISALKVISRTSVEQFRDTKLPMKNIADQLGVKSILEGGVQRAGDRVRINVQLIDAGTDAHLWAETYDRELTAENIFAIQTELAAAIAGALKAALTPAEKSRASVVPTRNLEAWEAYQLGKQRMAKRTSGGLVEAEKFFRKAIELDPKFALAWVGLADTLTLQVAYGGAPQDVTLAKARIAVGKALELDPNLAEGWSSSAFIAASREQYDRAETMFRRAIELNPNYATAHHWFSHMLNNLGRSGEALGPAERAVELDPLSAVVHGNLAHAFESQARFREAAAQYRRAIEIDPSMPVSYSNLGYLMEKAVELDPGDSAWSMGLANLYLDLGDESQSFATIDEAAKRFPDDPGIQLWLAGIDLIRRDNAGTVQHARHSLDLYPRNPSALFLLRNADLRGGRVEDALARYRKAYPELFVQGAPRLDGLNYGVGIDLALVLQKRHDTARADVLLDAAAQAIGKVPKLGLFGYGITDVQIHALRGEKRAALAALREAEKAGWRGGSYPWRYARDFDPALASIRNEPEFKAVFADIERDMARQRAELAARPKDAPLNLGEPVK